MWIVGLALLFLFEWGCNTAMAGDLRPTKIDAAEGAKTGIKRLGLGPEFETYTGSRVQVDKLWKNSEKKMVTCKARR